MHKTSTLLSNIAEGVGSEFLGFVCSLAEPVVTECLFSIGCEYRMKTCCHSGAQKADL